MALKNTNDLFEAWTTQKIAMALPFYHQDMERRKRLGLTVKKQLDLRRNGASLKTGPKSRNKLRAKLRRVTPRGKAWMRAVELSGL